ncbi:beta-lactamase [Pilimelia terevasa]|uniref:Beta-lactamase n=1 Tax=Pilimelia terevasa TaxID=53372 RepID=A0A8J3BTQ2_9ACTN|nr:class A beta-lactamase [Pilimelia terevasa]GGK42183.1 beta-lactamase [Pilimelia terevasa]
MVVHLSRRHLLVGASAALLAVPTAPASAATRGDWRARLRELERRHDVRIGACALDTARGTRVGYRAGQRFPLLSTFKAFAAAAVLDRGRHYDPGLLDRRLYWTEADLVPYSPVTDRHVADGLTVAQLCDAAVVHSDNTAGNLLLGQVGGPAGLTGYLRRLGDPVSRLDRWEPDLNAWVPGECRDTTTPAAAARLLAATAVGNALAAQDRGRLNGWLRASVTGAARIRAGLPADWTVGDKTGTSADAYGAANDIAVATPPGAAPLVMSVYTRRPAPGLPHLDSVVAATATVLAQALGGLPDPGSRTGPR